jgi:DNA-binding response OmpR family regulator
MTLILIVEDDARVRDFLVRGLQAEGHEVKATGAAQEGLDLALAGPFDVLLLDVMLPGFSGKELCRRLRAKGVATPILMLTAMDAVEDKVDGLRGGADDYLTKPFDFDELLARIEALARRGQRFDARAAAPLEVGPLVLDREAMTAHDGGILLDLTGKEFELLECLMSAPGKVLSRTRILNKVWGYSADPLTNVVDVYIRRLRAKLDHEGAESLIQTVRGYGYKLVTPTDRGAPP